MVITSDRLIVGYDASADAERGLEWAVDYAERHGRPVSVYAASGDLMPLTTGGAPDTEATVKEWLEKAAHRLEHSAVEEWDTVAEEDRIVPVLLEQSKHAAVVVLGARGHGLVGGMLLGSVSQHVSRHAACPVVVVRAEPRPDTNRIVVGVDGSGHADHALEFAFAEAERSGASILALHGARRPVLMGPEAVGVSPLSDLEVETGERVLSEALAGLGEKHPDVVVETSAVTVPPVRALVDASTDASLVVLGTRGHGGFAGLMLGSTSAGVLHHAECPVAIIR